MKNFNNMLLIMIEMHSNMLLIMIEMHSNMLSNVRIIYLDVVFIWNSVCVAFRRCLRFYVMNKKAVENHWTFMDAYRNVT